MNQATKTKIFFTDLDGTLLTEKKEISPATRTALQRWADAGHKLVLSSGRAIDSVKDVRNSLGLNYRGMYLIGCNGGEIFDCESNRIISRTPLAFPQVALVMKTAKEEGIHCHTYTDTHIISPAEDEELLYYRHAIHTSVLICEDILSALDKEPCKCIAIELQDKKKLEHFRQTLLALAEGKLELLYSNDKYLEIFPISSGKGAAVRKLCHLLGIPLSHSLAAGDEANDISMIQAAGVGIAMQNAKDSVKQAADIVTPADNDHDGLAQVLLEYI